MLWAPYGILLGHPHSVSSQLEGLFISLFSISCDHRISGSGHLHSEDKPESWAFRRRGQFAGPEIYSAPGSIVETLRPLIENLHDLFW